MPPRSLRPSPALIVALIALFVALGGTGYAVSQLPRNSVGTKQLRNRAVTTKKIRDGAITGAKIKKGSISAADISGLPAGTSTQQSSGSGGGDLHTFNVGMNRGDGPKTVATLGPFTLSGRCQSSGSNIQATLEASTTAAGSYFQSDLFVDSDWNPGETRTAQTLTAAPGARLDASSQLKMFNTAAGFYTYIDDGEPVGVLIGFQGAECRFIGHLVLYG